MIGFCSAFPDLGGGGGAGIYFDWCINTERFKSSFVNRLFLKHNLSNSFIFIVY